jgi:hypothetical protein
MLLSLAVALGVASCGERGGGAGLTVVRDDPVDEPVDGATADDRRIFAEGDRLFERVFRPSQGSGRCSSSELPRPATATPGAARGASPA